MSQSTNRSIKIFINNKEVENNIRSIQAEFFKLNNQIRTLDRSSDEYKEGIRELRRIDGILQEHRDKVKGINKAWDSFKTIFLGTFASNVATEMLSRAVSFFPQLIRGAAELEDQLADMRKTTGLTTEEVEALNQQLGTIDTRTGRKELREIAVIAGQLGYAKADIFDFVESTDKLNVALGDEFAGGAAEIADQVGRLRNVLFGIKSDNPSMEMLNIGNALNELGASGAATAPVITDFANRIGGVGVPLGLTQGNVLGMSASMQELSINAERGGTAVTKILQHLTTDTAEFAEIAGIPLQQFTKMVNEDLYGAFKAVLEGTKSGGGSATQFAQILDKLGLTGSGASEVFSKLANNIGFMDEKVMLATRSLGDTSSIMDEFDIKNATLGASIEKLGKDFNSLFTSKTVVDGSKAIIGMLISMVNWLKRNAEAFKDLGKGLVLLTMATIAWFASIKLKLLYEAIAAFISGGVAAARWSAALSGSTTSATLLKGAVGSLNLGLKTLWTTMVNNPLGAILTGIMAVVSILDIFIDKIDYVKKQNEELARAMRPVNDEAEKAADQLNKNFNVALDQAATKNQNLQKTVEELNKRYGTHIKFTDDSRIMTERLVNAKRDLITAMEDENRINELNRDLKLVDKNINLAQKDLAGQVAGPRPTGNFLADQVLKLGYNVVENKEQVANNIEELKRRRAEIKKEMEGLKDKKKTAPVITGGNDDDTNVPPSNKPQKKITDLKIEEGIEAVMDKVLDAEDKYYEQLAKIEQQSLKSLEEVQRQYRYDQLKGYDLLLAQLEDKYADTTKATTENFEDQKAAFLESRNDQLKALGDLERKNAEALAKKEITPEMAKKNQEQIDKAKADVVAYYGKVIVELEAKKNESINALDQALAIERQALNEKTFQEIFEFYKEQSTLTIQWIEDLQIQSSAFRKELAIQNGHFKKHRQELRIELALSLSREIKMIEAQYNEQIRLAREKAEELKKIGKEAEAQAMLDQAMSLEQLKADAIRQVTEESQQQEKEALWNSLSEQVSLYQDYANRVGDILGGLAKLQEQRLNKEMRQVRNRISGEQNLLEEQLANRAISQEEYNNKKIQLENELKHKENEAALKAWKMQQRLAITSSIINGALAVTGALAAPPFPPLNLPTVILTGVMAGIQTGIIASQSPPEYGKGAYFENGPKHSDASKGLWVIDPYTGQLQATFEQGEMLLSENTVKNNPELVFPLLRASKEQNGRRIVDELLPPVNYKKVVPAVKMAKTGMYELEAKQASMPERMPMNSDSAEFIPWKELTNLLTETNREIRHLANKVDAFERDKEVYIRQTRIEQSKKDEQIRNNLRSMKKVMISEQGRLLP